MRLLACGLGFIALTYVACAKFGGDSEPEPAPAVDAGVDASKTVDAGAGDGGPFSWPAQVTDDFERGDAPLDSQLGFTLHPTTGGTYDINSCDPPAPADACSGQTIRFTVNTSSNMGGQTYLNAPLIASSRKIRFDFGMKLIGNPSHVQLVNFQFGGNDCGCNLFLEARNNLLYMGDQYLVPPASNNAYSNEEIALNPLEPDWARYQIYVDLDAAQVTVAREGVIYVAKTIRSPIATQQPDSVRIGTTYTDGQSSVQQFIDNIGLIQE